MNKTKIEWTDATWNPIRGCSRVSEGCRNCYAEKVAYRFSGPGQPYEGLVRFREVPRPGEGPVQYDRVRKPEWNGQVRFVEKHLLDPLRWRESRRIFVNSMSDLFHENCITDWIVDVFAVMALSPRHSYQVLTKRAANMQQLLNDPKFIGRLAERIEQFRTDEPRRAVGPLPHLNGGERWYPLANVWLGVSVEDQKAADERIPLLLQTPAAVRFISAEPLLGPICFRWARWDTWKAAHPHFENAEVAEGRNGKRRIVDEHDGLRMLDWVIAGGESGPGARPMHPEWARSLRDQCQAAGVPFFFKQWGEWMPWEPEQAPCWKSQHGKSEDSHALFPENIADNPPGWDCGLGFDGESQAAFQRVGKHAAGAELDGREWREFPA